MMTPAAMAAESSAVQVAAPSLRTVERFIESVKSTAGRSLMSVPDGLVYGDPHPHTGDNYFNPEKKVFTNKQSPSEPRTTST